jgi:hypothetical protein
MAANCHNLSLPPSCHGASTFILFATSKEGSGSARDKSTDAAYCSHRSRQHNPARSQPGKRCMNANRSTTDAPSASPPGCDAPPTDLDSASPFTLVERREGKSIQRIKSECPLFRSRTFDADPYNAGNALTPSGGISLSENTPDATTDDLRVFSQPRSRRAK